MTDIAARVAVIFGLVMKPADPREVRAASIRWHAAFWARRRGGG